MSADPRSFNTPKMQSLNENDVDQLGRAVLSLTKELSIVSDRLRILEDVLSQNDVIGPDIIDQHLPNANAQKKMDGARSAILESVFQSLTSD